MTSSNDARPVHVRTRPASIPVHSVDDRQARPEGDGDAASSSAEEVPAQEREESPHLSLNGGPLADLQNASLETLYRAVCEEYSPTGITEIGWCRNIAQYMHHAQRLRVIRDVYLRYLRVDLFRQATRPTLQDNIDSFEATGIPGLPDMDADDLVSLLTRGRTHAQSRNRGGDYDRALNRLAVMGITPANAEAKVYMDNIDRLEAVEKLILTTDNRKDTVVRDLEWRQKARLDLGRNVPVLRPTRSPIRRS